MGQQNIWEVALSTDQTKQELSLMPAKANLLTIPHGLMMAN